MLLIPKLKQPHLNGQDVPARKSRTQDNGVQSNGYPDGVHIARDLLSGLTSCCDD